MSVIDIIEQFQTRHALREEQETTNSHASTDGAPTQDAPDKNGMPGNGISETEKSINNSRGDIQQLRKGNEHE